MAILLLGLFLVTSNVSGTSIERDKRMTLRTTGTPIIVDGAIDPVWSQADSVSDFVQFEPYNMKDPSRVTTAKVLTSEDALYCLIVCRDRLSDIQQTTGKLDDFGGDIVSIMLDTFGDKRTAYKFATTASGVRADCRLLDDARDRDYSWDGVWFASSQVYDWGFVVEMEIPYRTIQYKADPSAWGLDFDRWIPHLTEDIYWCPYEKNEGQRISKFGSLEFDGFYPTVHGRNLEIYPVGIAKTTLVRDGVYKTDPQAGVDILYNPSEELTLQLTGNPDFAHIEADPFEFNISRYETYYSERRPFFTEGNEIFMASGRDRSSGFYTPLELFYSRRIGRKLPDGSDVPLIAGTKAFGRIGSWEYGGFLAFTGNEEYQRDDSSLTEPSAIFESLRLKRQILENSSIGALFVGKHSGGATNGVVDIDGAFRSSNWQLAYQVARSINPGGGGYAASAGFRMSDQTWLTAVRSKIIQKSFDVSEVGFVPWRGTADLVGLSGPRWFFEEGPVREVVVYGGPAIGYEKADNYTDIGGLLGLNMQFRNGWGYEVNLDMIDAKDRDIRYTAYDVSFSSWFNTSPRWNGNVWGGYSRTYNFDRDYLGYYMYLGASFSLRPTTILDVGSSLNGFVEWNTQNVLDEVTYNARPYISITPLNDLNFRLYIDAVILRSTDRTQQLIGGFLFSYMFLPKSWIYLAINETKDRRDEYDAGGGILPNRLHTTSRAGVLKVKYLYFF